MIPADAVLTRRPDEIPAYDDMPEALKPILAREMEVYAGFLEHTDHHVGRLLDTLEELEVLDDTLIYYIFGDNGASAEGTPNGCFNEVAVLNGMGPLETPEFLMSKIDDFGGPEAYNHYAVGWAHAMNTPYQWTKQVASHLGGTRNGTIVHWPRGIKAQGRDPVTVLSRHRYRADDPRGRRHSGAGIRQRHAAGAVSRAPACCMRSTTPRQPSGARRSTSRCSATAASITRAGRRSPATACRGWAPTSAPSTTTCGSCTTPIPTGPSRRTSPRRIPTKLAELQRLFLIEATKYSVLPLDDRTFERFNADLAGRPQLIKGNSQILFGGMSRLSEGSLVVTHNKSYSLTAEIEVPTVRRQRRHRRAWAAASAAGASTR